MTSSKTQNEPSNLRLARYLREFVGLRTTTIRDIANYDEVLWFGNMPQGYDCQSAAWTDDFDEDDPWLEVRKQQFEKVPAPPESVQPWVDRQALSQASHGFPPLRSSIFVPDDETVLDKDETPPLKPYSLDDHPEVRQAYERYRPRWEAWSKEYLRRKAIQKVYADLFRLHTQVQKQGELVEVVLGVGLLDWRTKVNEKAIPIRRHVVVAQVDMEFDPDKGVIRIRPPGDGARLQIEDDMLEAELRPDRTYYDIAESQLNEIGDDIWDKPQMHSMLKAWVGVLNPNSQWSGSLIAWEGTTNDPVMSFAPALIMRKRTQTGMARIYDRLIEQLSHDNAKVPKLWHGLIKDVEDSGNDLGQKNGQSERVNQHTNPSEVYFPLAANREQRRIVRAIDDRSGVLVQGPPGTGKSHTIVNLMCHLLATGKRLLITAETGRALRVLKESLPEEIQPLCISLLGQGGDAFAELSKSVQGITTRQATYSPGDYKDRIDDIDQDLDNARRRLAETGSELRSLREDETSVHLVADGIYHGTASAIAGQVAREKEQYKWLQLPREADARPPLSNEDMISWLEIRRRYTEQQISEANKQIPSSDNLPSPTHFAALVHEEAEALKLYKQHEHIRSHGAYGPILSMSGNSREQLQSELESIEKQLHRLRRHGGEWSQTAIQDLILGQRARWSTVLEVSGVRLPRIENLIQNVSAQTVELPEGRDARKVLADVIAVISYFKNGGNWKRFRVFTPKEVKGRTYLKDCIFVDGEHASDTDKLEVVRDKLELEFELADLQSVWNGVGVSSPEGISRLRFAELTERTSILKQCFEYADGCDHISQSMTNAAPSIPVPDWTGGQSQEYLELIKATFVEEQLNEALSVVDSCANSLGSLRELHDVHPVVNVLLRAIKDRDVRTYSQGHARIVSTEQIRWDQQRRMRVENVLANNVPSLVECVSSTLDDEAWEIRFRTWRSAWHWAITDAWLDKRSDFEYQQQLWERQHEIETEIGELLAEAAALRAWTHFFDRLSPRETAALKSWREAVRAMGKGTGKSAKMARLRQEARQYMAACREAIPVWIMPRYLVAEMVDPAPDRYDLVIVDEASQLGIESLFLFYIAKKIVVVGDDQQISPYGVGVADAAIAGMQKHYLEGIPHLHALSAQSSLYGNAKIRFSQNIVLREHFRCMPEIIQFSNDLCYASNGTPLDPLRAYTANRLQPLVLRHVPEGYRIGGTQHAQNPPEADAVVSQIHACVDDPRYSEATMGVISLQGEGQAKLIERKLLETLDPAIIEERRLICGDAYAFQGDERNIIFLSMVAAPGESRIGALTAESARQRFNVAASRAQDQLWLFHTANLDVLSDSCMRHRLLSYMLDPSRQTTEESEQHFDSRFERDVYRCITERGFHVRTQVLVGDPTNHRYRIDLVVEGMRGRLAVECDGDEWHGPERYEHDMARQRDLERAGWQFVRIRGSDFYRDCTRAMEPVWSELKRLSIEPGGIDKVATEPPLPANLNTDDDWSGPPAVPERTESSIGAVAPELSIVRPAEESDRETNRPISGMSNTNTCPPREPYANFNGEGGPDPRHGSTAQVSDVLVQIITVEGPMLAKRSYDIYLRSCGIHRMGGPLKRAMNKALQHAIRSNHIVLEDESGKGGLAYSIVRSTSTPPVIVRERGPRTFDEIPPSELQFIARWLLGNKNKEIERGSDNHLKAVLRCFDLKRLTTQAGLRLLDILNHHYPYVDEMLDGDDESADKHDNN